MFDNQGLNAGNSSGIHSSASRRRNIPTFIPQIRSVSQRAIEKIFTPELPPEKKDKTTKYADVSPAQRRVQGKKRHNARLGKYQAMRAELNSVVKNEDEFPSITSTSTDRFDEFDAEFYARCARIRAEQDEERRLDDYFSANYDCCVVYEAASVEPYEIPPEYSSTSDSDVQLGDVIEARSQFEANNISNERNDNYDSYHCRRNTTSDSRQDAADLRKHVLRKTVDKGKSVNADLQSFVIRQSKSKDFDGFPKIHSERADYAQLIKQKVSIPAAHDHVKKFQIPRLTAIRLISRKCIQTGTVIYCPQGIGKSFASSRYPAIIDSTLLPITFRNKHSLRRIANSGNIVLTSRIRDCDEDTIYLIPDEIRFIANLYARSLKSLAQITGEYKLLMSLRARKFHLKPNQYLADFLKYRMKVYRQVK